MVQSQNGAPMGVTRLVVLGLLLAVTCPGCDVDTSPPADPPPCPDLAFERGERSLEASIALDEQTTTAGSDVFGVATLTNVGSEPAVIIHNRALQAIVFTRGTETPVGVFRGPIPAVAISLEIQPGESQALPVEVGTTPCGPGSPRDLPAGTYDVRVVLPNGLSEPALLNVTE